MKKFAKFGLAAASLLGLTIEAANAAVPAGVTSALSDAGTDGITVAGAVLVVVVGIAAFKYMRRAL
jgi:hypothetical protein